MKVIVVHDSAGRILSIGRIEGEVRGRKVKSGAGMLPGAGQSVLEVEISGELAKKSLGDIRQECSVDLKAKKLVRRNAS